jgi:hypothetical protein
MVELIQMSPEAIEESLGQILESSWREYIESPSAPKILYHYCSELVMRKILLHSRCLRASDVCGTNDSEEIVDAFADLLGEGNRKTITESSKRVRAHVACFSSDSSTPALRRGAWGVGARFSQ